MGHYFRLTRFQCPVKNFIHEYGSLIPHPHNHFDKKNVPFKGVPSSER